MERREVDKTERVPPSGGAARKPYAPPRLRVYGSVAALTRTIGNMSMKADGGGGMNSKTG
ncbi:MAG: lasso RiPP family leader peptide-containing protein [Gemmatimonadales bacterium]